jgi:hypothetical protein
MATIENRDGGANAVVSPMERLIVGQLNTISSLVSMTTSVSLFFVLSHVLGVALIGRDRHGELLSHIRTSMATPLAHG